MNILQKILLGSMKGGICLLLMVGSVVAASAQEEQDYVFNASENVAIEGYDVVAYHTDGKAIEGDPSISVEWEGVEWHFATEENRALFVMDPEQYIPEYGGYCAYAAANGAIADVNPKAFTVVDDRLYLNFSHGVRRRWERDRDGYIDSADRNWPTLRNRIEEE